MGRPYGCAGTEFFTATDSEKQFQRSLKTRPADWHYRTQNVVYHYNSQGFRAPDLNQVNWKRSIVIFGCSQTEGVGLDESETMNAHLEKITGIPVINLGVGASAMHFSYTNNLILRKNYPMPLGVINFWTSCKRMVWYGKDSTVCIMPVIWDKFYKNHYFNLYTLNLNMADIDHDDSVNAQVLSDSATMLWENTQYAEATWIRDTAEALDCRLISSVDYARDAQHQGPQTARMAAEYFAEQLNL